MAEAGDNVRVSARVPFALWIFAMMLTVAIAVGAAGWFFARVRPRWRLPE